MGLFSDIKVLYHLVFKRVRGNTHAQRMDSFYGGQADDYDSFRKRLLQGRQELWEKVPTPVGGVWVDMGGGTGNNLEYFGPRIKEIGKVYVVDLATSLLGVCQKRADQNGWSNVKPVEFDATKFVPEEGMADVVTFSYSLTMIPDWFAAIENALKILKPGGLIAVVDFYVARKYPAEGHAKHGWFTRPAQCGVHAEGRETYGHALVVDPWGEILADGGEEVGIIVADIDPSAVAAARRRVPSLSHDRPFM